MAKNVCPIRGRRALSKKKKSWRNRRAECCVCGQQRIVPAESVGKMKFCNPCLGIPLGTAVCAIRELAYINSDTDAPTRDPYGN